MSRSGTRHSVFIELQGCRSRPARDRRHVGARGTETGPRREVMGDSENH